MEFFGRSSVQIDFISAMDVLEPVPKGQVRKFLDLVCDALHPGGPFPGQVPNLAASYLPLFHTDFSPPTPFAETSLQPVLSLVTGENACLLPVRHAAKVPQGAIRALGWKAGTVTAKILIG
jgi:hypothetical protein